jgi:hypothetical protein
MASETLKTLIALYDKTAEQMENNFSYAQAVEVDTHPGTQLQNSNNVYWRNVEQQRPVKQGWDMTGEESPIIEQGYPLALEDPWNDFIPIRVDDLRDKGFLERASRASADRQNSNLNKGVANLVSNTGSLYYESSSADFDFVAEADTLLTERQAYRGMGSSFFLTPRNNQLMAGNLASRTLYPNNRSENAYGTALIGENVAGFDVLRAPTYGTVAASAYSSTIAADVLNVPEGSDTSGASPVNIDYRLGTVTVASAVGLTVGDVVTMGVNALGLSDKTDTGELMTFKVTAISGTTVSVFPKPIAAGQAGITDEQAAYANIASPILSGAAIVAVNTNGGQSNAFWANDSICVVNGDAPLELLNEFDGMKVVSQTLKNGVKLYMAYDANLATLNCRVRLFTWYGLVNKDPSRNGVAIKI